MVSPEGAGASAKRPLEPTSNPEMQGRSRKRSRKRRERRSDLEAQILEEEVVGRLPANLPFTRIE
jgi:hypothetical protein